MSLKYDHNSRIIIDEEDGQHIAELCDGATPEQGKSLVESYNLHEELISALRECHQALQDHVQYEDDEDGSLEGDGFRAADAVLKKIYGEKQSADSVKP